MFKTDLYALFGEVKGDFLYNKIMSKYKNYKDEIHGLQYEIKIYAEIIKRIEDRKISPNFVEYVAHDSADFQSFCKVFHRGKLNFDTPENKVTSFNTFVNYINPKFTNVFDLQNSSLTKDDVEVLTNCYLKNVKIDYFVAMWVQGPKNKILDYIKTNQMSENEMRQVLFQLLVTLYLMEILKIQHNDLHSDNVLIEKLPSQKLISYQVDKEKYEMKTKYLIRIYDWDVAFVDDPHFGINYKTEQRYFKRISVENKFKKNFDFFFILCYLLKDCHRNRSGFCRSPIFEEIFADLIAKKMLNLDSFGNITGWGAGGSFILSTKPNHMCRANNEAALAEMPDLKTLLKHNVFKQFLVQNPSPSSYSLTTRQGVSNKFSKRNSPTATAYTGRINSSSSKITFVAG